MQQAQATTARIGQVRFVTNLRSTKQVWGKMLRCQWGTQVKEALDVFAVATWQSANGLLREFPGLAWELLFVAICESRQACNSFQDGGETFSAIVETERAHPKNFNGIISSLTQPRQARGKAEQLLLHASLFGIGGTFAIET